MFMVTMSHFVILEKGQDMGKVKKKIGRRRACPAVNQPMGF